MRVAGAWLDAPATQDVLRMLDAAGWRAFVVGGAVRNALMDMPVGEIDIATDAPPERVMTLAGDAGFRAVATGIAHGTVTVIAQGTAFEVTTFRRDVATDGRHARVVFGNDLDADAARRDFTINALYADAFGRVIDPLGGMDDIRARRVRFVGDAMARIREDHLRILRFFRFHAWYGRPGAPPDAPALAACRALADGVLALSHERIGAEMRKLLAAPDPALAVHEMAAAGILARVLAGADDAGLAPLLRLEEAASAPPRWQRRLATLGGADPADALRLSRAEAREQAALREAMAADHAPAALGFLLGAERGEDALLARAAVTGGTLAPGWRDEILRGAGAEFPLAAADLMPALSGRALGEHLRVLREKWLAADLRMSRASLLAAPLAPAPGDAQSGATTAGERGPHDDGGNDNDARGNGNAPAP